ncbi:MAG: exo-beta-N-acetylmuramidase NamZ domain-containing protein, partial [bacterium]
SDLNFMLLAEIVRRVTGQTVDRFAQARIFEPLGMRDTLFTPPSALTPRIAPTEACAPLAWPCGGPGARMLRGVVHDPTARRMGGVAGHAGLFSTARDLARFSLMLLRGGALEGVRVLASRTVARMTEVSTPSHLPDRRGLGWDIDSRFSSNRGDLFGVGSFGHTGFTGTSLWLDPDSDTFVVFLSSRLHPSGQGDVTRLRGQVATLVAASLVDDGASVNRVDRPVWTGIDVLREEGFTRLSGSRVGLVTNQTGRARDGATTVDLLHDEPSVELVSLFSPEHGIQGRLDGPVSADRDPRTGLPIHSLYGDTRRPSASTLQGLDTIVIDLQDVGARFYTYATTMAYVLEAASEAGVRVMVLDRPNPIGGAVEGPALDESLLGFTGYFPSPVRHGLTLGELARLFNTERSIGADLEVVSVRGWRRGRWFDETGLPWVDPSPNLRNLHQALLYPGIGAIEGSNLSVGRGTDTPFEQIGAPWIDGVRLARELNELVLPGVRVYPVRFRPSSSRFAGEPCEGVFFVVTDRDQFRPVRFGLEVAAALLRLFGDRFELEAVVRLFGSASVVSRLRAGDATWEIAADWASDEAAWRRLVAPYLLYE